MVSKLICAIISLVGGLLIGIYFLDPIVYGIANGLPCPIDENWAQTCLNVKNLILIFPPIAAVAGFFKFFQKIDVF